MSVEGVLHMHDLEISGDQWEEDVMKLLEKIKPEWGQEDVSICVSKLHYY